MQEVVDKAKGDSANIGIPKLCSPSLRKKCETLGYCEQEAGLQAGRRLARYEMDRKYAERNGGTSVFELVHNLLNVLCDVEQFMIERKEEINKCKQVEVINDFKLYETQEIIPMKKGRNVQRVEANED